MQRGKMQDMDWVTLINTAVGLMGLFLGGFSIWLALYFYTKAKDSEAKTIAALESIKVQSEMLQKLTGKWMDRFTRHATEPRPADEGLLQLVNVVATLPQTILSQIEIVRPQQNTPSQIQDAKEIANCYIGLYYYTALSNVLAQSIMPPVDAYDANDQIHTSISRIINQGAQDFKHMERLLDLLDRSLVQGSSLQHLLEEAINTWRPSVKDVVQIYAEQRQA